MDPLSLILTLVARKKHLVHLALQVGQFAIGLLAKLFFAVDWFQQRPDRVPEARRKFITASCELTMLNSKSTPLLCRISLFVSLSMDSRRLFESRPMRAL